MLMKKFKDIELSRLGYGNMRLPVLEKQSDIDFEKASALIDYAMSQGVNYYDTAYVYHSGNSESFLGKALKKYPRESFYIATKFNIGANPDYKAQFAEQLERLDTDYVDFYLLHAVGDGSAQSFIDSGCIGYFEEQQKLGRIRYLGFSSHSSPEVLEKFASLRKWDFAQIQLNYYDWNFSTAKKEYEILTAAGIPVMVMEPCRGGRLASLGEESDAALKKVEPERSVASWAFRWAMSLENVQVILSGMSTMDQVVDNCAVFTEAKPLTKEEEAFLFDTVQDFRKRLTVPCTGCRYCCDTCPMSLEIPDLMQIMNRYKVDGHWALRAIDKLPEGKRPADCLACGACMVHCPQNIKIPDVIAQLAEAYEKR